MLFTHFSDDRHPYFKPGKPKEENQEEEDLNDANYDEVSSSINFSNWVILDVGSQGRTANTEHQIIIGLNNQFHNCSGVGPEEISNPEHNFPNPEHEILTTTLYFQSYKLEIITF